MEIVQFAVYFILHIIPLIPRTMEAPMQFYHITVIGDRSFDETIEAVTEQLKKEGFGVITNIDISAKIKEKTGEEIGRYVILGACNPPLALHALQVENKIGVMLPCNVIIRDTGDGSIEVASIDPLSSMAATGNAALISVAEEVSLKLKRVVESI